MNTSTSPQNTTHDPYADNTTLKDNYIDTVMKEFIKWCDEPMSANGNDREEMFMKIWTKAQESRNDCEIWYGTGREEMKKEVLEIMPKYEPANPDPNDDAVSQATVHFARLLQYQKDVTNWLIEIEKL